MINKLVHFYLIQSSTFFFFFLFSFFFLISLYLSLVFFLQDEYR